MNRIADIVGKRYGRLLVLEKLETPRESEANGLFDRYRCKCDCGRELTTTPYALNGGKTSCCCDRIPERNNLRGWRFGRLTVIRPVLYDGQGNALRGDDPFLKWECRCDCGNTIKVYGLQLIANQAQSCGCGGYLTEPIQPDFANDCTMRITGKRTPRIRIRLKVGAFEYDLGEYYSMLQALSVKDRAKRLLNLGWLEGAACGEKAV